MDKEKIVRDIFSDIDTYYKEGIIAVGSFIDVSVTTQLANTSCELFRKYQEKVEDEEWLRTVINLSLWGFNGSIVHQNLKGKEVD